MPVSLSHFGEDIICKMVCSLGRDFLKLCPGFEDQNVSDPVAITEARMDRFGNTTFDGASRIDMLVMLEGNRGLPFEIKLGKTRLTKGRIDGEWLTGCTRKKNAWSGNMMSVLERKFEDAPDSENLGALNMSGQRVELTQKWFLIARESKINSWGAPNGEHWPSFTQNVGFVSLESIVHSYAEPLIPGRGSTRLSEGWSTSTLQHVDPGREE